MNIIQLQISMDSHERRARQAALTSELARRFLASRRDHKVRPCNRHAQIPVYIGRIGRNRAKARHQQRCAHLPKDWSILCSLPLLEAKGFAETAFTLTLQFKQAKQVANTGSESDFLRSLNPQPKDSIHET